MPLSPFEHIIKYDDSLIKYIRNFKAFKIKSKYDDDENNKKKKKPKWNAFELIPDVKQHGIIKGMEYYYKLLCKMASGESVDIKNKLYYECPLSEVWEEIAFNTAINKANEG